MSAACYLCQTNLILFPGSSLHSQKACAHLEKRLRKGRILGLTKRSNSRPGARHSASPTCWLVAASAPGRPSSTVLAVHLTLLRLLNRHRASSSLWGGSMRAAMPSRGTLLSRPSITASARPSKSSNHLAQFSAAPTSAAGALGPCHATMIVSALDLFLYTDKRQ